MRGQAEDPSGEALSPEKGWAWPGFPGISPDLAPPASTYGHGAERGM